MDIIDLYFSDQEFGPDREREITQQYDAYIAALEVQADRFHFELAMEM